MHMHVSHAYLLVLPCLPVFCTLARVLGELISVRLVLPFVLYASTL